MSNVPTPEQIASDATWLAQALDAREGLARLVRMDSQAYRDASFLDDRMLSHAMDSAVLPWPEVASAVSGKLRADARWIFHIGHVGSTLVARLLGELEDVLSVREPRILRDVAMLGVEQRADIVPTLRKLLSRTFAASETALVKATSFVSEIASELVPQGGRALFIYASPRTYVASILAGENSVKELAALRDSRARRMAGRVDLPQPRNAAEAAAAAWACETSALEEAAEAMADSHVAWTDFDRMLDDLTNALSSVAQFFGFDAAADRVHAIASGPLTRRYSKALEYEYSPALRRELIAEADAANRGDIDSALAMLELAAEKSPLLERALARCEEG